MAAAMDSPDPVVGRELVVAYLSAGEIEMAWACVQSIRPVDAELYGQLTNLIVSLAGPRVK